MSLSQPRKRRSDIQALRAIAVLAVIAFHYKLGGVSGGYLGVDIFFVISGFVITQRLLRYDGALVANLKDFYLKRAKRLLPTALLVGGFIAIFSRLFLPSISLAKIARESFATTLFIPNLFFAHEANNYLNQGLDPSPYLHYWSLGVEEQFYLLWPLLLIVILRKRILGVLLALMVATIVTLTLAQNNLIAAFYQPWFRAWEFLAGALLVFIRPPTNQLIRRSLALIGWVGVLASISLLNVTHADPGISTLAPVIASVLVILGGLNFPRGLGLIFIGDISYSLYLVHWPLFVLLISRFTGMVLYQRFLLSLAAIGIAALIYRYFESPLRSSEKIMTLRSFALPTALVTLISFGLLQSGATATAGTLKISREAPILYSDGCHLSFNQATPKSKCFFGDLQSSTLVILAGDSHAAMHFPGINLLAERDHWKLLTLTKSSCPAAEIKTIRAGRADRACAAWEKNLPSLFLHYKARYIFLAGASEEGYALTKGSLSYPKGFTITLDAAIKSGATPVLLSDTPYPKTDSPTCLLHHLKNVSFCDLVPPHSTATRAIAEIARGKGAIVVKPETLLCKDGVCPAVFNGGNVYRDSSHISIATSLRLETLIDQQVKP